jgi:hypothetical protein
VLRIRIRDPVPLWPLGPGSGMGKKIKIWDPGWTFRIIFPRAVTVLSTDTRRKENWICSKSINIIYCLLQCSGSGSGSIGVVCFGPPRSGSISQRYGSGIPNLLTSSKNSEKKLDSSCFVTSLWLLSLKNDVNEPSKSTGTVKSRKIWKKLVFLLASCRSKTKIAGSGAGSNSQRHEFGSGLETKCPMQQWSF